jgi:hypothetical protein
MHFHDKADLLHTDAAFCIIGSLGWHGRDEIALLCNRSAHWTILLIIGTIRLNISGKRWVEHQTDVG